MTDPFDRSTSGGTNGDEPGPADVLTRVDGALPARWEHADDPTLTLARTGHPEDVGPGDDQPRGPRDSAIGTAIGRFVVLGTLGRGGMGTVYEAFDRELDRRIAVKVLRNDVDSRLQQRLMREAKALAQLNHPNVVQVYEVGRDRGRSYVAMELVRGRNLRQWQASTPCPDWSACVTAYRQAGAGLAAAHRQGLVHRDFKPANAIIDEQGRVRVLDFGLARTSTDGGTTDGGPPLVAGRSTGASTEVEERLTETGLVMGTPAYMPLEQILNHPVDARSDQFSFCVALWEAVYGTRPFVDRPTAARVMALREQDVIEPPEDSTAPEMLRELLLRGLATEPRERWPTMEALLEPLGQLVSPRRRPGIRLAGAAAILGTGLAVAGLALRASPDSTARRCTGARAQLEGVWDPDRRKAVRLAISSTGRSYSESTAARVGGLLDAHAGAWVAKHTEVCEATRVTQEQSEAVMDLRMGCLRDQRMALRAAVDVLEEADLRVVDKAVELVEGLPSVARCDGVRQLEQQRQRVSPPTDPRVAEEVQRLRERLEAARAQQEIGAYDDALAIVGPVVDEALGLGYSPLVAEARLRRGMLREAAGRYREAEDDLVDAHVLAVEHDYESVELRAARALGHVVGIRQARLVEGLQWARSSMPLARRIGDATEVAGSLELLGSLLDEQGHYDRAEVPLRKALVLIEGARGAEHLEVSDSLGTLASMLFHRGEYEAAEAAYLRALSIRERHLGGGHPAVASSLMSLGVMSDVQGRYEESEARYRRALEIEEATLGSEHPRVAACLHSLGVVLNRRGRYAQADAVFRRALRIRREALGPEHPDVAETVNSLGNMLVWQQRYEESEAYYRQAVEIVDNALGPEHPKLGSLVNNLGNALYGQDKLDEAEREYRRAVQIKEQALGAEHPSLAMSIDNLGNVLGSRGELVAAEAHHRRALRIREAALGPSHSTVADSLHNLGNILARQGEFAEAEACYRRALSITVDAFGATHVNVAETHLVLAEVALDLQRPQVAREHAEQALSIYETKVPPSSRAANARFALARALWAEPSERARAHALAVRARDAWRDDGSTESRLEAAQRWLGTHRAP